MRNEREQEKPTAASSNEGGPEVIRKSLSHLQRAGTQIRYSRGRRRIRSNALVVKACCCACADGSAPAPAPLSHADPQLPARLSQQPTTTAFRQSSYIIAPWSPALALGHARKTVRRQICAGKSPSGALRRRNKQCCCAHLRCSFGNRLERCGRKQQGKPSGSLKKEGGERTGARFWAACARKSPAFSMVQRQLWGTHAASSSARRSTSHAARCRTARRAWPRALGPLAYGRRPTAEAPTGALDASTADTYQVSCAVLGQSAVAIPTPAWLTAEMATLGNYGNVAALEAQITVRV